MNKDPSLDWRDFPVSTDLSDKRLDIGLQIAGITETRSQAAKLIKEKLILVNGKPAKASRVLQMGDIISAYLKVKIENQLTPYDFPIEIIFEDSHVIVVNKPAGLVVHPSAGHPDKTLVNALVHRNTVLSQGSEPFRPGLVHRIDKGTSGLLVLAKNNASHNHLAQQFKNRTIQRIYWALTYPGYKEKQGRIETYIGRDPRNRKRFGIVPENQGKHAISNYKMLTENQNMALVEMKLETGRTHQIRVHLKELGHPIIGDDLYDGKKRAKNIKKKLLCDFILNMDRFALHAKTLGFRHPSTGDTMNFNCELPEELNKLLSLSGLSQ